MWIFTKKKLKHKTGSHQLFLAETAYMSWPSKPRKALLNDILGGFLPINRDLSAPPLAPWHLEPHAGVARHVLHAGAFAALRFRGIVSSTLATLRAWPVCLPFSKTNVLKWVFWGKKRSLYHINIACPHGQMYLTRSVMRTELAWRAAPNMQQLAKGRNVSWRWKGGGRWGSQWVEDREVRNIGFLKKITTQVKNKQTKKTCKRTTAHNECTLAVY